MLGYITKVQDLWGVTTKNTWSKFILITTNDGMKHTSTTFSNVLTPMIWKSGRLKYCQVVWEGCVIREKFCYDWAFIYKK